ncbi:3-oxoacyl-[acyl-carrier-protein] synthase III C-terminal domain-containing protein [Deinococcus radiomollis]|uniref:type III polyketide synthase n=1 Tax=Deinococcus radiomollis TaxID=468916 RepID=UPI003892A885
MVVPSPALPVVQSIATGTPPHHAQQSDIQAAATQLFPRLSQRPKLMEVFSNAQIERRALARPLEWYMQPRSFAEKNAVYVEESLALCERLTRDALSRADRTAEQIDAVVFVSSTGISTPSLESVVMERLGINRQAVRLPLWGLGCAGGAQGLARAADLVRAGYQNVLLLAVEMCSLTLVAGDQSSSNFVGTALFSDGGAALLLGPDTGDSSLARIRGARSTLLPQSQDVMGWDVDDGGLKVRFSQDIPGLVAGMMRENVDLALEAVGWTQDDLNEYIVHPGGAKVVAAYEQALGLENGRLVCSRKVLRDYGNMSSATVLFVLEQTLRRGASGRGLLSAMGPGFCAEHVLLEFPA